MGTPIYRHLTDDGLVADGSNQSANVNGVVTAVPFYAGPADGKVWRIHRMVVVVEDDATFTAVKYGGVATLANGITVKKMKNGPTGTEVLDLLDNTTISGLIGWGHYCYDVQEHTFGSGSNFALVRWTFAKSGEPLLLNGANGDVLVVQINDDLSTLVDHTFMIQGVETTE
jgi:hypothetical protein